jgi:hypothetical protein
MNHFELDSSGGQTLLEQGHLLHLLAGIGANCSAFACLSVFDALQTDIPVAQFAPFPIPALDTDPQALTVTVSFTGQELKAVEAPWILALLAGTNFRANNATVPPAPCPTLFLVAVNSAIVGKIATRANRAAKVAALRAVAIAGQRQALGTEWGFLKLALVSPEKTHDTEEFFVGLFIRRVLPRLHNEFLLPLVWLKPAKSRFFFEFPASRLLRLRSGKRVAEVTAGHE